MDSTAKVLIPRSMPTVVASMICFFAGNSFWLSTSILTKYFPVVVLERVTVLIVPVNSLSYIIGILPSLGNCIVPVVKFTITFCGNCIDCFLYLFLNFGNPPPLKNLV